MTTVLRVAAASTVIALSALGCTSGTPAATSPSRSPAATPLPSPASTANIVILQRGRLPASPSSTHSPLIKTSTLALEATCIGEGELIVTVSVLAVGFSSNYPVPCSPRENVQTFTLGKYPRGATVDVETDKESHGKGVYYIVVRMS